MASLILGTCKHETCASCGKSFSEGGGIVDASGETLGAFCRWCIAIWLDYITGHLVSEQLLDWETKKHVWSRAQRRARERNHGIKHLRDELI